MTAKPGARTAARGAAHRGPAEAVFVGRAAELTALARLLERLSSGLPACALVLGEAGVGKTRLLAELVRQAERSGFRVLRGRADALSPNEFLGVLLQAAPRSSDAEPQVADAVGRLLAALELPGRRAAIDAYLDLLEACAAGRPVLLTVDDLQWADPGSRAVLASAIQRLTSIPVGIVAAARAARSPELASARAVVAGAEGLVLELGPLPRAAVSALARETIGLPPGRSLLRRLQSAAGNPLWIGELLHALVAEGLVREREGVAEVELGHLPASLQTTVLSRLGSLAAPTVDVLKTASLFARPFRVDWVAALRRQEPRDLLEPLGEAVEAGVLVEAGDCLTFRHDLIREAIYLEIPQALRATMHRETALVLRDAGAAASRVAAHFALGARPGDTEAVAWLWDAGRNARRRAPTDAADYLRKAYDLLAPGDPRQPPLLVDLLEALVSGGFPEEAAARAQAALPALEDADEAVDVLAALGRALLFVQQPGRLDAAAAFDEAIERLAPGDPRLPRLQAEAAYVRIWPDRVQARRLAESALDAARAAGDRGVQGLACFVLGCTAFANWHIQDGIDGFRDAVAAAERLRSPELLERAPHLYLAWMLQEADEFDEAAEQVRRSAGYREELYSPWSVLLPHGVRGLGLFDLGEWPDAITEFETMRAAVEDMGTRWGHDTAHAMLALIAHEQGRDDDARRYAAAIPPASRLWKKPAAILVESQHDPDGALRRLRSITDLDGLHTVCARLFLPRLVRFAVRRGAAAEALPLVQHFQEFADRARVQPAVAAARHLRALVEGDVDGLLEALAMYRGTPRVVERAHVLHDAAVALAGAGRRDMAMELFREAGAAYHQIGALRQASVLRAEMRAAGLAAGIGEREAQAPPEWDALTKTELKVLHHVAEGLTNREIAESLVVSRRTVETHVAHILQKLNLRTRAQVAAAVARRGSLPGFRDG